MKKRADSGTTLVEVIVGSLLLVSIVGIVTLTLAAVFEGYAATQARSAVDQDGQYILARLRYVASQQDPHRLYAQHIPKDFAYADAQMTNLEQGELDNEGLYLSEGSMSGEYISPTISLLGTTQVDFMRATTTKPPGARITYQIAVTQPVTATCANAEYVYVGPDGQENTYFETDYFEIPQTSTNATYVNPGTCVRYKALFVRESSASPSLQEVVIGRW